MKGRSHHFIAHTRFATRYGFAQVEPAYRAVIHGRHRRSSIVSSFQHDIAAHVLEERQRLAIVAHGGDVDLCRNETGSIVCLREEVAGMVDDRALALQQPDRYAGSEKDAGEMKANKGR